MSTLGRIALISGLGRRLLILLLVCLFCNPELSFFLLFFRVQWRCFITWRMWDFFRWRSSGQKHWWQLMSQARIHLVSVTVNTVVRLRLFRSGKKYMFKTEVYVKIIVCLRSLTFCSLRKKSADEQRNKSFVSKAASPSNAGRTRRRLFLRRVKCTFFSIRGPGKNTYKRLLFLVDKKIQNYPNWSWIPEYKANKRC